MLTTYCFISLSAHLYRCTWIDQITLSDTLIHIVHTVKFLEVSTVWCSGSTFSRHARRGGTFVPLPRQSWLWGSLHVSYRRASTIALKPMTRVNWSPKQTAQKLWPVTAKKINKNFGSVFVKFYLFYFILLLFFLKHPVPTLNFWDVVRLEGANFFT